MFLSGHALPLLHFFFQKCPWWTAGVVFGPIDGILMIAYHEIGNVGTQTIKLSVPIDIFERKV